MTAVLTETRPTDDRVERLSTASIRKVLEPEEMFDWSSLGAGQVLPDELLSVAGLGLDLTPEQKARLSREETASMLGNGLRFEAILTAGFAWQIAGHDDLTDPRVTYMLHEIGEESRHSRAFARLITELGPTAVNPLGGRAGRFVQRKVTNFIARQRALLCVMILAGEEIPDLLQKMAVDHPDTDPLLASVNRYHRQEEARHLAFARMTLPELYAEAGRAERRRIRWVAPILIGGLFQTFVHPGVYRTIGLPGFKTWKAAHASKERKAVEHQATRPILQALLDAGVVRPGRIPLPWRQLCGVDRQGQPLPA
jgi:hypothetical protein